MSTISPTLASAYRLLRLDLFEYLDQSLQLTGIARDWSSDEQDSARSLITDLTTIVRGVLMQHKEDIYGYCHVCKTDWPCSAVRTIHDLAKDPDNEFVRLIERARSR